MGRDRRASRPSGFGKDTGPKSVEMLRQIVPVARTLAATARANNAQYQVVRCMGGHHGIPDVQVVKEHKSSVDFLPVPQGSWQEDFNKRNAKYNMMLGASLLFFGITIF